MSENKEEKQIHPFMPTEAEMESFSYANEKWIDARRRRETGYLEFSDMTLSEYINRSDRIYNALQRRIEFQGKELSDLQSNIPRNKVSAINAKVSVSIPSPVITTWGKDGNISAGGTMTLQGLNDWTEDHKKSRILHIRKGNQLFNQGTVVTYNDFNKTTRTVRDITKQGIVPETKERVILNDFGCFTKILPLLEVYFASYYIPDIQNQPFIIWKRTFTEDNFHAEFNKQNYYKNTTNVLTGKMFAVDEDGDYSIENQEDYPNKILVLKCFDKINDRIITLANGVVIQDTPFPWSHKQYPFALAQSDFFSNSDFIYGMSIPHKLSWDVEAIEFLVNAEFEQAKIAINPPMINYGMTEFEDDVLYAGRVIKSEGAQGDIQTLDIKGIDQSVHQLLGYFTASADIDSVDSLTAGNSTGGKGITARRDVMAQGNAREMLGVSRTMILDLEKQEQELQLANILQFYPDPIKITVLGEGGKEKIEEINQTFRVYSDRIPKIDSTGNINGTGKGVIEIDINEKEIGENELNLAEDSARIAGVNLQKFSPSPEFIRNLKYLIHIPYTDDFLTSNDNKFNKLITVAGFLAQFSPELVNKPGLGKRLVKLSGEDEAEILLEEQNPQQDPSARDNKGSLTSRGVESQTRTPESVNLSENFGG